MSYTIGRSYGSERNNKVPNSYLNSQNMRSPGGSTNQSPGTTNQTTQPNSPIGQNRPGQMTPDNTSGMPQRGTTAPGAATTRPGTLTTPSTPGTGTGSPTGTSPVMPRTGTAPTAPGVSTSPGTSPMMPGTGGSTGTSPMMPGTGGSTGTSPMMPGPGGSTGTSPMMPRTGGSTGTSPMMPGSAPSRPGAITTPTPGSGIIPPRPVPGTISQEVTPYIYEPYIYEPSILSKPTDTDYSNLNITNFMNSNMQPGMTPAPMPTPRSGMQPGMTPTPMPTPRSSMQPGMTPTPMPTPGSGMQPSMTPAPMPTPGSGMQPGMTPISQPIGFPYPPMMPNGTDGMSNMYNPSNNQNETFTGVPMFPLYGYDNSADLDKDVVYMKQMFPQTARIIQPEVDNECDQMEYDGSIMFDEYPDQVSIERIVDRIYEKVKNIDEEPQMEAQSMFLFPPRRRNNHLRDIISLLLLGEIFQRRRRHRSRRRWF